MIRQQGNIIDTNASDVANSRRGSTGVRIVRTVYQVSLLLCSIIVGFTGKTIESSNFEDAANA
jgi:hypothetical protein